MEKNIEKEAGNSTNNTNNTNNSNVHNNGEAARKDVQKYGFDVIPASAIQDDEYNAKDFIIDGIVTPGLNILAGPKKHGKSLLALNMALCIAGTQDFCGRKTEHGKALYMMLEDTPKRAKDRMNEMLGYTDAPELLAFTYGTNLKGPALPEGLEAFLQDNPDTKVIIIDVLELIRTPKASNVSDYAHDYGELGPLQKLSNKYGVAIIVVTHCKKGRESDRINEISGGVGVTSAADTIIILKRKGNSSTDGTLFVIGRDVPQTNLAVRLNDKNLNWEIIGTAEEESLKNKMEKYHSSPAVKAVKALLEKNHGQWSGTSRELLNLGLGMLGEPIAKNESALARELNDMDNFFLDDSITHVKPNPHGGNAGRVHHFAYVEPPKQPQGQDGQDEPSKVIPMEPEAWVDIECGEDEPPFN